LFGIVCHDDNRGLLGRGLCGYQRCRSLGWSPRFEQLRRLFQRFHELGRLKLGNYKQFFRRCEQLRQWFRERRFFEQLGWNFELRLRKLKQLIQQFRRRERLQQRFRKQQLLKQLGWYFEFQLRKFEQFFQQLQQLGREQQFVRIRR
jgi:hypothetical protein